MRKKLLIIFTALCLASVFISGYVIFSIEKAASSLEHLNNLNRIADMRDRMLREIEIVQDDLNLRQTRYARDLAQLVSHVSIMTRTVDGCFGCHHESDVVIQLNSLKHNTEVYKKALSRVYTVRANEQRLMKEEDNAYLIGVDLIRQVRNMLAFTNQNLALETREILSGVNRSRNLLLILTISAPITVIIVVTWFYKHFTKPISSLLTATSHLQAGDLDYRIEPLDDEFGEVARSFNNMSAELKDVLHNMVRAEQMVLMGEMSSRLAHEIKNPITGIKLAVQIVKDEVVIKGEYAELCSKTLEQIKSIERLMTGLLNFARPPAPYLEREDINSLIATTLSTLEIIIREKEKETDGAQVIKVVRQLDENLPQILTDNTKIQQILMNLMLNAVDAMPEGGTLTVKSSIAPEKGYFKVDISDTGHGIDPEIADRIFEPFYSTKTKGTGLGLAIVTRLVELLEGDLHFRSDENTGTTFTVCLPINVPESAEQV